MNKVIDEKIEEKLLVKDNVLMALFFLEEFKKSKYSRLYKEYSENLPASCHNYPVFFDDNELVELKGSPFASVIQER